MKHYIFPLLLFVSYISYSQNSLNVIQFGDRKPDLYYWDTNWYDRYQHINPNISIYPGLREEITGYEGYYYACDMYVGRACYTNSPLLVRGIAGAMHTMLKYSPYIPNTRDTTINGRLPEDFRLYDNNHNLVGEKQIYTNAPAYKMQFRNGSQYDTFKVYEAYFDKPVLVNGFFYVGGTTHNNRLYGVDPEINQVVWDRVSTLYPKYAGYNPSSSSSYSISPFPQEVLYKYNEIGQRIQPIHDPVYGDYFDSIYDTNIFYHLDYNFFLPFFAIIDTDYVYYNCQKPVGLGLLYENPDSVVVFWDSCPAVQWDVMLWPDGSEPDSGFFFTTTTNHISLSGLDTSIHYNIKVLSVCDTFHANTSPWSNTFRFYIPDYIIWPCPKPENLYVQSIDTTGVTIVWDTDQDGVWELSLWSDGSSDTTSMQIQTQPLLLRDLDTARWYNARIRTICSDTHYEDFSEWTDTVRFFVPNPNPDTGVIDPPIAIDKASGHNTRIMPNPTSGKVTVSSDNQLRKIELMGNDGKQLASFNANGNTMTIDLSNYSSGTYFLCITTTEGLFIRRLVKK
jgi:hypothetical protein